VIIPRSGAAPCFVVSVVQSSQSAPTQSVSPDVSQLIAAQLANSISIAIPVGVGLLITVATTPPPRKLFSILMSLLMHRTGPFLVFLLSATCPAGWTFVGAWCYINPSVSGIRTFADTTCANLGGRVPILRDQTELNQFAAFLYVSS
jgi:hypothetical protein